MTTCQHRNTTFSRDICPDPCGVMHTSCDDCNEMVDACVHVDPANWTREQAQAAQAELDELERTNLDVAAAAASYDQMVERVTGKDQNISPQRHLFGNAINGTTLDDRGQDARAATMAERAAADELTHELDTVYAVKHTEADWVRAGQILRDMPQRHIVHVQNELAQALAAERAAIHARYEAVAAECDDAPDRDDMSEDWQDGRDEALLACSARIRQVAAQ